MNQAIVIMTVLSGVISMYYCFLDVKALVNGTKRRKPYEIITLSLMLGSFGVILAQLVFGYQKGNWKHMVIHYIFAIIHSILIGWIMW